MKTILNKWLEIIYYALRLNGWPKFDLYEGIIYSLRIQLYNFILILFIVLIGIITRKIFLILFILLIPNIFITKFFVVNFFSTIIKDNILNYEKSYEKAKIPKKVFYTIIGYIIGISIFLGFIFSFKILNYSIFK